MNAEQQIARIAHEAVHSYCQAIGDKSLVAWEDTPQWLREGAVRAVQLHIGYPDAGPQACHDNWAAHKLADGWKYGPEERPDLKEHPYLLPFTALPREQRAKDYIFRGVVLALNA